MVVCRHLFDHEYYVPVSVEFTGVEVDEANQVLEGYVALWWKIQILKRKILSLELLRGEFVKQIGLEVAERFEDQLRDVDDSGRGRRWVEVWLSFIVIVEV